jgi:hypothetical protein
MAVTRLVLRLRVRLILGRVLALTCKVFTLDWTQIAGFIGSPLITPFHAIANTSKLIHRGKTVLTQLVIGMLFFTWIISIAVQ